MENIVDAFNGKSTISVNGTTYDFTLSKGEVVYAQGGHTHNDGSWVSPNGVPFVTTDTDSTRYGSVTGTQGTITEHCFDVVTVDYVNKTIKMVRVGRGENREFNY